MSLLEPEFLQKNLVPFPLVSKEEYDITIGNDPIPRSINNKSNPMSSYKNKLTHKSILIPVLKITSWQIPRFKIINHTSVVTLT